MKSVIFVAVCVFIGVELVHSKPATSDKSSGSIQAQGASSSQLRGPVISGVPRRVVTSWSDNGWQASARLPSSSQSGGNENSSTKDLTGRTKTDVVGRNNRRLHKWDKTEEVSDESDTDNDEGDGTHLAQSLNSMASHLMDKGGDESLENSSERDVFVTPSKNEENGSSTDQNETDEVVSDEEASPTNDPKTEQLTTWQDEEEERMMEKQKSDGSPTTPKGLTTWSAVNGGVGSYIKGSVQKIPSDFTVSGALTFNTDRPTTSSDSVGKERSTGNPTTELPRTTKSQPSSTTTAMMSNAKRRKPYHKNKKVVLPSKFVKPALEEVTAEAIGTDATHTIYKTKVAEPQSKTSSPNGDYLSYTTKRPQWPYQMPVKKIVTTKRPMAFSRITAKPKNPYVKKPQATNLSLTTPTTTTPSTTTVYHRQPAPLMYPFPSISFTNLGFMDFLRSQIIPRIGLSLISFMAASPLILSMIGATAVGRRKRSLDTGVDTDRVKFEYISNPSTIKDLPKFDFSTIKKKLYKMDMIHKKPYGPKEPRKTVVTQLADIITKLMNTKGFAMLKSKIFETQSSPNDTDIKKRNKFKHS